jgi:hypothetical protein
MTRDEAVLAQIINARGYLVLGSEEPIPAGEVVVCIGTTMDDQERDCDTEQVFVSMGPTTKEDYAGHCLASDRALGLTKNEHKLYPHYIRVVTD